MTRTDSTADVHNVFYDEAAAPETVDIIQDSLGSGFRVRALRADDADEELRRCRDADFLLAGWRPVGRASIEAAERLRGIHKLGAGVDKIDLGAAAARGIPVTSAAGANARQVAEHAVLLMLAHLRRLRACEISLRAGEWQKDALRPLLSGLAERTVAIVGFGAVGRAVARRLAAFDCRLRYYDPLRAAPEIERQYGVTFGTLPEVLGGADIVTLHVPLTPFTRSLIGAEELRLLPDHALVVNTSRGGVLDQSALLDALEHGRLGGAALDVFATEPLPPGDPLLAAANVVLTPHVAGSSRENIAALATQAGSVFEAILAGGTLPDHVTVHGAAQPASLARAT